MKCFQERYIGIISSVKALYYVCKIAGLFPFSFNVNPEDGFGNVNTFAASYLNTQRLNNSCLIQKRFRKIEVCLIESHSAVLFCGGL